VMVIVSHDRELLGLADQIADLSGGQIRMYGGSLEAYEGLLAAERAAAERAVAAASAEVRREQRDLVEAQVKQARRDRQGRQVAASGGLPRIVAYARKRAAQETAGRSRELHAERLQAARDRLEQAERSVRDDAEIRVDLPGTALPAGRTVLTVTGLDGPHWHPAATAAATPTAAAAATPTAATAAATATAATAAATATDPAPDAPAATLTELIVRGPERIALTGPNGAGKTTLLRAIAGLAERPGVTVRMQTVTGYLPQRLDTLDDSLSVVDNVRAAAPAASVNEIRASLARFLLRGDRAERLASMLSGGERFRAVLAALLLAQPPPQLLLLDEPTNNLDLASVRQLSQALEGYRGAILVASHDVPFLRSAGITRWLHLDRNAGLTEIGPP
jgi:ATPase subunit of ABC transporter with duplicated ATPase domains